MSRSFRVQLMLFVSQVLRVPIDVHQRFYWPPKLAARTGSA